MCKSKHKVNTIVVKSEKIEIDGKSITLDNRTAWAWVNELGNYLDKLGDEGKAYIKEELPITHSILKQLRLVFN